MGTWVSFSKDVRASLCGCRQLLTFYSVTVITDPKVIVSYPSLSFASYISIMNEHAIGRVDAC